MNESLALAKHITDINYRDIPSSVVDITKKSLLDGLGVMLAASRLGEGCKQFVNLAIAGGGKKESTIIGVNTKVPAAMAAFANGSMSHALDFEDFHDGASLHPNAAAIPAALAVAESIGNVSGKEFITALTLGSDIVCRLGLARSQDEDPLKSGWYMPPILGAFGATTAACKLLSLSVKQVLDAFSLTLCQATCSAELIYSPHSIIRAIRDAFSAKAGVLSALLAQKGITGFAQPIEGKAGLFTMYSRGKYNPYILTDGLGRIFEGANVSFKPWPACAGTHPYIEATLQIVNECNIKPSDIKGIKLVVSSRSESRMLYEPLERKRNPATVIDAKFSLPFAVATALVYKSVTLGHFTPQALLDQGVLDVAQKVTYEVIPKPNWSELKQGLVQIRTKHEEINSKMVEFTYGHPKNPISQEALVTKFMDCAAHSAKQISKEDLNKLVELILHLEDVGNVGQIVEYL
jgi:2-methylcitrate dehydratase PrpD